MAEGGTGKGVVLKRRQAGKVGLSFAPRQGLKGLAPHHGREARTAGSPITASLMIAIGPFDRESMLDLVPKDRTSGNYCAATVQMHLDTNCPRSL